MNASRIAIQRAYLDPGPDDGYRVLVDRFWPRGRSKAVLRLDEWARDLAPPADLIHWFGHDAARWQAFRQRYRAQFQPSSLPASGSACAICSPRRERVGSRWCTARKTKITIKPSCCASC